MLRISFVHAITLMLSARAAQAEAPPVRARQRRARRGRPPQPQAEKLGRAVLQEGARQLVRGLFSLLRKR